MLQKQKSLLTKCLAFLFIICCSVVMVLGMTACSNEKTITSIKVEGTTLILTWSDGSEERIDTKGEPGNPGNPGEPGKSPVVKIGDNGNWFIDDVDTGVAATGEPGKPGEPGHTPVIAIGENGNWTIDGVDTGVAATGEDGKPGENGKDAPKIIDIKYSEDGTKLIFVFDDNNEVSVDVPAAAKCDHSNEGEIVLELDTDSECEVKYFYICKDCGNIAYHFDDAAHSWGEPKHLDRDCENGGRTVKVCENCGKESDVVYDEGEEGTPLGHEEVSYEYEVDKDGKPVTDNTTDVCGRTIKKVTLCERCGKTLKVETVKAPKAHEYKEWRIKTAPNYALNTAGELVRDCVNGDSTDTVVLPAIRVADEDGNVTSVLTEGYAYKTGKAPVLCNITGELDVVFTYTTEHNDETVSIELTVKVPSTKNHVVNGNYIEEGKIYDLDDPKYGGKLDFMGKKEDITCGQEGTAGFFKCEVCDTKYSIRVKKAHAEYAKGDKIISKTDEKCETDGELVYECSVCHEESSKKLPAIGHDVVSNVREDGDKFVITRRCANGCGKVYEDIVASEYEVKEKVEATCTTGGYTIYYNFKDLDGNLILEDDGTPVEIKTKVVSALGHLYEGRDDIKEGGLYDIRDARYATAFEKLGTISCGNTSATKPGDGFWTCHREGCNVNVPVKLYKSHTGGDPTPIEGQEPTCENPGKGMLEHCDDCNQSGEVDMPALGHKYEYTVETVVDNKPASIREKCVNGCGHDVVKTVTSIETIVEATCEVKGKYSVLFDGATEALVVELNTINHRFNGEEMRCADKADKTYDATAWEHPYNIDEPKYAGIEKLGTATCKKLTAESNVNGYFVCDDCGVKVPVYITRAHSEDGTRTIPDPKCGEDQVVSLHCKVCTEDFDYTVKGVDHAVTIDVDVETMTLTVKCTREGCGNAELVAGKVYNLPAVADVKLVKNAETGVYEVVGAESDANYTIVPVNELSCVTGNGKYTYTLKAEALKKLITDKYIKIAEVKFDITYTTGHFINRNNFRTWVDGGKTYKGYICDNCGKLVSVEEVTVIG